MGTSVTPGDALTSVWDVIDGVRIHGRVNASPSPAGATTIVFVHGLGVSTRYMEPTMRRLADAHAVAGIDLPGFGRSGSPARTLGLEALADTVLRWLDARRIGPVVFVGNSFGCQVIVECVMRAPRRAIGLVLNAPTMDIAHRSAFGQIVRALRDIPHESFALAWIVVRDYLRAGPLRLLATLRTALADRIEEKVPRVTVPVAVVCGALDPVVPVAWASEVARLVGRDRADAAGATLHVVHDGSHALPFDEPDALAAIVAALAARAEARTRAVVTRTT